MKTSIWAALAAAVTLVASAEASARPAQFSPYQFKADDGTVVAAETGVLLVPENRDDPRSRMIELKFVRFRSTSARPGPPTVYLAGGPGGSGIDAARGPRFSLFMRMRTVGDVIALDQRGVGESQGPALCAASQPFPLDAVLTQAVYVEWYRREFGHCLSEWRAAGVDLAGYDIRDLADDVHELRLALGVRRVNLVGISFGTQLAQAVMRRHPRDLGRVVLASAEGLDQTLKLPAQVDAFLTRVLKEKDPELPALMRRVHARLDAKPASVTFTPRGQETPVTVRFDSWPVRYVVAFQFMNDAQGIARLPALYRAMDAGDHMEAGRWVYTFARNRFRGLRGMPDLVDLASGASPARLELWRAQAPGSLLGDVMNFPSPHAFGVADNLTIDDSLRAPFVTAVPTLFIVGTHDGRTPIESQADLLASFNNRRRIVFENGGHNIFEEDERVIAAVERFLRDGEVEADRVTLRPPA